MGSIRDSVKIKGYEISDRKKNSKMDQFSSLASRLNTTLDAHFNSNLCYFETICDSDDITDPFQWLAKVFKS